MKHKKEPTMFEKEEVKNITSTETTLPFLRRPGAYDTNAASDESAIECKDPTLTQQHLQDETDINVIVARYAKTGEKPPIVMPSNQDFLEVVDFQTAMNQIVDAQRAFQTLPAKVRSRFDNDPQKFLEFCDDENNLDEARGLGLVPRAEAQATPPPAPPKEEPKKETDKAVT